MIVGAVVPPMIERVLSSILFGEEVINAVLPLELGAPAQVASSHLTQFDYMVPGMFAYSAIFVAMLVAQAFSTEREQGLLRRISLTPTSSSEVIMSQVVTNLILGVAQVIVVYGISVLMGFRPQAAAPGVVFAMVIVLFLVLCNVGFGLITASLVKTSGGATGLSFLFILPQMLLGTFVPASPGLAKFVPSYYVTDALTSLFLRGAPLTSPVIVMDLLIVAAVGLVTVVVGIAVFQRYGRG
jgi:ABC-2 type transport system permease protein